MPTILHGTWVPRRRGFFVWGETLDSASYRPAQTPAHPFQAPAADLPDIANSEARTLRVWLPTRGSLPHPSPELVAMGASKPARATALSPWRVSGRLAPIDSAIDYLLDLPHAHVGADLTAWSVAVLLAMEIVAAQQVMPALNWKGETLQAVWKPRPAPDSAQKLAALARALPPLCRAFANQPETALAPRPLVNHFVGAAVDAAARLALRQHRFNTSTVGGAWLAGLCGPDPAVKLKPEAALGLYQNWKRWSAQSEAARDENFRLTFRLEPPQGPAQLWNLSYLLQATDDPSLLIPAGHLWREKGRTFKYLNLRFHQPQETLLRGLGYAGRLVPAIDASLKSAAPEGTTLKPQEAFLFLKEAAPLLEQGGFGVLIPAWWTQARARLQATATLSPKARVKSSGLLNLASLVNFEWELTLGGQKLEREEFERLAALKQPLVQIRGQWVVLDPEQANAALKFFDKARGEMTLTEAMRLDLDAGQAALPAGIEVAGVQATGWLDDLFQRLDGAAQLELLPAPSRLQAQLRPYQERGYSWLAFLRETGFGACLADDMGLGKTVQTLALLLRERDRKNKAPALVVCPTSVVGNWAREIENFAPSLKVLVHRGVDRQKGSAFAREAQAHEVVLTSYPLLTRDRDLLESIRWDTVVLDEAQNIKNSATKQSQAARALATANRVALTGTPVENRLSELWSIMAFLNPGYLGSEETFSRNFARPIERLNDQAAAARLRKITAPFVLRRLKTDTSIIADLPEKMEMKVYCSLTREQATLYQAVLKDALQAVEDALAAEDGLRRRGLVLAMLMRLKQVCNHPAQFLRDGSPLPGRSGKLARLEEMLEEAGAEGDRALVFTQFAEMGGLLQRRLAETLGEDVLFLHGGTRAKERDEMVQRFQSPDGPKVFVLSLKAGGTGLNLTAANRVFHFDRWWNPAVENQATDRAFRIGQTRNVQVHKFICAGTLEDKIDAMIESKKALADSVLGAGESWLTELSTAQLRDLVMLRQEAVTE